MRANDCSLKLLGYKYYLIISVKNLIRNQSESLTQWEVEISLLTYFVTEHWIYPYQGQSSPSYCQGYTDLEFAGGAKSTGLLEMHQFSGVVRSKQQAAVNQLLGYNYYLIISVRNLIRNQSESLTQWEVEISLLTHFVTERWIYPYQGQSSPSYCQGYTDLEFAGGAKSTGLLETRQFSGVARSKQ